MVTSFAKTISNLLKRSIAVARKKQIPLNHCGRMCDECAFKWNQPHTLQYFVAADQAASALLNGGKFNCHTEDYRDAKKPCAGFSIVKTVFKD